MARTVPKEVAAAVILPVAKHPVPRDPNPMDR